jgi:hypothetical protein
VGRTGIYACGESVSRRNSLESVALFSLKQEAPASIGGSTFTIRNKENQNIVYGGQSYSIIEIAKLIAENKEQMRVIPGPVKQKEGLPLTQEEFQKLYASNGELSYQEECELSLPLPDYSKLMVPKQFQYLLNRECKIVCVNRYCMNLLYAPYWGKQR